VTPKRCDADFGCVGNLYIGSWIGLGLDIYWDRG